MNKIKRIDVPEFVSSWITENRRTVFGHLNRLNRCRDEKTVKVKEWGKEKSYELKMHHMDILALIIVQELFEEEDNE